MTFSPFPYCTVTGIASSPPAPSNLAPPEKRVTPPHRFLDGHRSYIGQTMTRTRFWLLGTLLLLGGCGERRQSHSAEFFPVVGQPALPFSEAVRVGNMLYLSGQLGTDSTGRLVPGGIRPETRQALANIEAALARHGFTLDQVVKCTVMLADIGEWAAMNEVYVTFFQSHRPARSAFGTSGLALDARLELECMAAGSGG
jgi:2-iminobutanoate/2-iminopropanoate deaminase